MSVRWYIGLFTAFLLLTIIGNVIEGADILTGNQVSDIKSTMEGAHVSQASDPTVGGVLTYGGVVSTAVNGIVKALTMKYSWLYDVDPTTHAKTPNEYYWIWAVIWWPIVVGIVFMLFMDLARLIRGAS